MAVQSDGNAKRVPKVIREVVARAKYHVNEYTKLDITLETRKREYVRARLLFYLVAIESFPPRTRLHASNAPTLSYLGYIVGGKDHATVLHAVNNCQDLLTEADIIFKENIVKKLNTFRVKLLLGKVDSFHRDVITKDERINMMAKIIKTRTQLPFGESRALAIELYNFKKDI
jgi:hypothetical protein